MGSLQRKLSVKFIEPRCYADPDIAARKIMEIANSLDPYMEGRLLIELINGPLLFQEKATPADIQSRPGSAVVRRAGWRCTVGSGTYRAVHEGRCLGAL
jgi:hypothetical protein